MTYFTLLCNTYLATVKKKKKKSVQQQCNICRSILEDHLVLFIILDVLCVYGKDILKSAWPNYLVLFKFSLKRWMQIVMILRSGPGHCFRSSACPIISTS